MAEIDRLLTVVMEKGGGLQLRDGEPAKLVLHGQGTRSRVTLGAAGPGAPAGDRPEGGRRGDE